MKKFTILMAAAAVALGFSSCSEDRDPVYQEPTEFHLNTPVMQNQFIQLSEGGDVLEFSCSQPDYGFSAITTYTMQMSLSESFTPAFDLETVNRTQARMAVRQDMVAQGLMELQGIDSPEKYDEIYGDGHTNTVYFRAIAEISGVESSRIASNAVTYNAIKPYFAVAMPGYIYLVGQPEGWAGPTESNAAHYNDWRLFEPDDAIGSKVYSGVFDIPAGSAMFRFYTALTGWDADSYGTQVDDNPIEYEMVDGSFAGTLVKGKGSFSFPNWEGGEMTIVVDMSDEKNMTVTMQAGSHSVTVTKYIYLVGSISGWNAPGTSNAEAYSSYRLADTTGSGVYTGTWHVDAGHVNFRFALELTDADWDNDTQIGIAADDGDVACSFTNGVYQGTYVKGKGNWAFDLDNAGTLTLVVDTNGGTVNYTFTAD